MLNNRYFNQIISEEINKGSNICSAYIKGNTLKIVNNKNNSVNSISLNKSLVDILNEVFYALDVDFEYDYGSDKYGISDEAIRYIKKVYDFDVNNDVDVVKDGDIEDERETNDAYKVVINNDDCGEIYDSGNRYGYVGYINLYGKYSVETYNNRTYMDALKNLLNKLYMQDYSDQIINDKKY